MQEYCNMVGTGGKQKSDKLMTLSKKADSVFMQRIGTRSRQTDSLPSREAETGRNSALQQSSLMDYSGRHSMNPRQF